MRWLCRFFHDWKYTEIYYNFGNHQYQIKQCQRCGKSKESEVGFYSNMHPPRMERLNDRL